MDDIYIYWSSWQSVKAFHALMEGLWKISAIPDRYVIANFPIKFKKEKEIGSVKKMDIWRILILQLIT